MRRLYILLVLICLSPAASAQLYKCEGANGIEYRDRPCNEGKQAQVRSAPSGGTGAGGTGAISDPTAAECRSLGGHYVAGEGCFKDKPQPMSRGVPPEAVAAECRKIGQRYVPALNACKAN